MSSFCPCLSHVRRFRGAREENQRQRKENRTRFKTGRVFPLPLCLRGLEKNKKMINITFEFEYRNVSIRYGIFLFWLMLLNNKKREMETEKLQVETETNLAFR